MYDRFENHRLLPSRIENNLTVRLRRQIMATGAFQIERGYFSMPDHEQKVTISSTDDFTIAILARNVDQQNGGIFIGTPPSQFRTPGSTGPQDGLVMNVGGLSTESLGYIGGKGGEKIAVSSTGRERITVFVMLTTSVGATVKMKRT